MVSALIATTSQWWMWCPVGTGPPIRLRTHHLQSAQGLVCVAVALFQVWPHVALEQLDLFVEVCSPHRYPACPPLASPPYVNNHHSTRQYHVNSHHSTRQYRVNSHHSTRQYHVNAHPRVAAAVCEIGKWYDGTGCRHCEWVWYRVLVASLVCIAVVALVAGRFYSTLAGRSAWASPPFCSQAIAALLPSSFFEQLTTVCKILLGYSEHILVSNCALQSCGSILQIRSDLMVAGVLPRAELLTGAHPPVPTQTRS